MMVAVRSLFPAPAAFALSALPSMFAASPAAEPATMAHAGVADVVLLLMVVMAVGAAGLVAYRAWTDGTRGADAGDDDLPPLVFHSSAKNTQVPAQRFNAVRRPSDYTGRSASESDGGDGVARLAAATADRGMTAAGTLRTYRSPVPVPREGGPGGVARVLTPADPLTADATLQILPGRLEVVSGDAGMREIRFVRPPGGDAVVTLGRTSGDPPGHVQLRSPAVSRLHARMRFDDGQWLVSNLSGTNPAIVNGAALGMDGTERMLRDGDQLELGDVVLRFRS
jgi:hypothetical protein